MPSKGFSLSFSQYVFLIYKIQIGIGVLTLPHDLFVSGGVDGWIAIIFGWAATNIISYIIIKTMEKHPAQNLFEILPIYLGKWIGKFVIVLWIVYALFTSSFVFLYTVDLIEVWVLPLTHPAVLGVLFLIPIYQIVKHGLPMISRFAEFTFLFTMWMYPVILTCANHGLWINLLPIAREGLLPILKSTPMTALSFMGFEMAFLLYPRLRDKKKAFKGIFIANSMTAFVLIMVTVFSFIRLSDMELANAVWPTLDLLKLIRFPFLERLEIIFVSGYIIILFMSIIPYLHMVLIGTLDLFKNTMKPWTLIAIFTLWVAALFSPYISFEYIVMMKQIYRQVGYTFAYIFPIGFWIYSKVYSLFRKGQLKG
jgi:spore germination protein (amino acid permease)